MTPLNALLPPEKFTSDIDKSVPNTMSLKMGPCIVLTICICVGGLLLVSLSSLLQETTETWHVGRSSHNYKSDSEQCSPSTQLCIKTAIKYELIMSSVENMKYCPQLTFHMKGSLAAVSDYDCVKDESFTRRCEGVCQLHKLKI